MKSISTKYYDIATIHFDFNVSKTILRTTVESLSILKVFKSLQRIPDDNVYR